MNLKDWIVSQFGLMRWNVLENIINKYGCTNALEIGVALAWTSEYLLKHCHKLDYYVGVDPYIDVDRVNQQYKAVDVFKKYDYKAVLFRMDSLRARRVLDDLFFDLIFIDGDHSAKGFIEDLDLWEHRCRFLCGHDYNSKLFPHITKILDDRYGDRILVFPDHVWMVINKSYVVVP